ncbi:MAG: hypothetical protein JSR41_00980 [Proteobacteria bacterium]|nr:hypothetical protein [Pseudomonadota bacterium]
METRAGQGAIVPLAFSTVRELLARLGAGIASQESSQCSYLTKYLGVLATRSYVVEADYEDDGFLGDYAGYYVNNHKAPARFTHRVHFFSQSPAALRTQWTRAMNMPQGSDASELARGYLGFMVVKPLPAAVIGRTCLRTPPRNPASDAAVRAYPVLRHYNVNFHGLRLHVESVAFQEQDREIAVCATAAVWTMMHALPALFTTHRIPSPFEITVSGWDGRIQPMAGEIARKFPSSGMDLKQIVGCLRDLGVEASVIAVPAQGRCEKLLEHVAALLPAGYPVLMVGSLYTPDRAGTALNARGLHAAVILGYSHTKSFRAGAWSERIDRLFIHDDTLGPFCSFRVKEMAQTEFGRLLEGSPAPAAAALEKRLKDLGPAKAGTAAAATTAYLTNAPADDAGLEGEITSVVVPAYLVVPVHVKQHLPYTSVRDLADQLTLWYEKGAYQAYGSGNAPAISWSVVLRESGGFKADILATTWLPAAEKEAILCKSTPRLLWVLKFSGLESGQQEVDFLQVVLDATSLQQSCDVERVLINSEAEAAVTLGSILQSNISSYVSAVQRNSGRARMPGHLEAAIFKLQSAFLVFDNQSPNPA